MQPAVLQRRCWSFVLERSKSLFAAFLVAEAADYRILFRRLEIGLQLDKVQSLLATSWSSMRDAF